MPVFSTTVAGQARQGHDAFAQGTASALKMLSQSGSVVLSAIPTDCAIIHKTQIQRRTHPCVLDLAGSMRDG